MNLDDLKAFLGPDQILTDEESLNHYGKDWTKHISPRPSAVVFPKKTEEVVTLVQWARKNKTALVPSGGRTGLSGAAIATNGEVVVSFEKMNRVLEFNAYDQTLTVEAGVVTEEAQKRAEAEGLYFPVDFASRGSSQIGGNIATNAGGIKVLRYGMIRNWVSSLEVVTGRGEKLELNRGLIKNATGYDLRQLFIGSEGTLGFITRAVLQLTRNPSSPLVFLFAVPELEGVMKIYHAYKSRLPLLAFEMFTEEALEVVLKHTGLSRPLGEKAGYYVLVEIEQEGGEVLESAMGIFENGLEQGWMVDGVVSQSAQQAKELWRLREDISEATSPFQPYKNDISVRVSQVPEFLTRMNEILVREYPDFKVIWFGHIGDGNLHVNILKPESLSSKEFLDKCLKVNEKMFAMIQSFGGSISAEHGVGLTKKPYLKYSRSPEEIEYMRMIKKSFDPDGILNPGKIFD
jgi:FAD/FMN-containing dehydrogenase